MRLGAQFKIPNSKFGWRLADTSRYLSSYIMRHVGRRNH